MDSAMKRTMTPRPHLPLHAVQGDTGAAQNQQQGYRRCQAVTVLAVEHDQQDGRGDPRGVEQCPGEQSASEPS